jgi:lipooligosaccharide transport system permease protein
LSVASVSANRQRFDLSLRGAWRFWHRNATVFRRIWLLGIMAWFAEPVIYLVAMGLGLGKYLEQIQGVRYITFIAPGLLATSTMFGATFASTWDAWFKMERTGVYHAAASTPISVEDVALGEILWAATRASIYGTAFMVIATLFGVFQSWWGLLTLPGIALVGLVFAITGLIYTYWIKHVDYLAYYWTLFITPMFMFAGVFFPLERLPAWVPTVAWFMPLHHAAELMRALMTRGDPAAALGHTLWLAAVAVLLLPAPLLLLRRRLVN